MKIAIIGYGKMGQLIEQIAIERGHEVACIIDNNSQDRFQSEEFTSSDVAIEFSVPHSAVENIKRSWSRGVKVVCGTTGWNNQLPSLVDYLKANDKTMFWSSNFSLGVNLFFELNRRMAELMSRFPNYDVSIEETHHIHKKDAPSGTAITLAERIVEGCQGKKQGWILYPERQVDKISIEVIREGEVFGIHTAKYESDEDFISFTHEAKSRRGFALGAVLAAEFIKDKQGFFTMKDMLNF